MTTTSVKVPPISTATVYTGVLGKGSGVFSVQIL
jgi:hypothetical protein